MTTIAASIALTTPTNPLRRAIQMFGLRKQRKALAALSDAELTDIGVTFQEAQAEAARPMWDCPAHWRA